LRKSFKQRLPTGVKILPDVLICAQRHLVDGEFARKIAAGAEQARSSLGVGDIAIVEHGTARNLVDGTRPQQATQAAGQRLDLVGE